MPVDPASPGDPLEIIANTAKRLGKTQANLNVTDNTDVQNKNTKHPINILQILFTIISVARDCLDYFTLSCPISFRNCSILVPADISVEAAITFL